MNNGNGVGIPMEWGWSAVVVFFILTWFVLFQFIAIKNNTITKQPVCLQDKPPSSWANELHPFIAQWAKSLSSLHHSTSHTDSTHSALPAKTHTHSQPIRSAIQKTKKILPYKSVLTSSNCASNSLSVSKTLWLIVSKQILTEKSAEASQHWSQPLPHLKHNNRFCNCDSRWENKFHFYHFPPAELCLLH